MQGKIVAAAGKPVIHVRTDDAQFRDRQVIDVENGLQVDSPVGRLEGRVAVRKVHAEPEELGVEELIPVADEVGLEGIRRALEAGRRRRDLPGFEQGFRGKRDVQERVLADDRVVALEHVLIVGVPPVAFDVRIVVDGRMAVVVAIPGRKTESPAVFDRHEVARLLVLAGKHAAFAGITERRIHGLEERLGLTQLRRRGRLDRPERRSQDRRTNVLLSLR